MKLHHFALVFLVILCGFFLMSRIHLLSEMKDEEERKTSYECLVCAVNSAAEVVFSGDENNVTEAGLRLAEEVFFQTLAVLWDGSTDKATWMAQRERVPCFAVFSEKGYYWYGMHPGRGYGWSKQVLYENGRIPESFYEETEKLLQEYHNLQYKSDKKFFMKPADKGIWDNCLKPPCVFAVYAPKSTALTNKGNAFLYAASGKRTEAYYVTEDNYCHLLYCEKCNSEEIVACYVTQKESAEAGALPCEYCMK